METKEKIKELYEHGVANATIAEVMGLKYKAVYKIISGMIESGELEKREHRVRRKSSDVKHSEVHTNSRQGARAEEAVQIVIPEEVMNTEEDEVSGVEKEIREIRKTLEEICEYLKG